MVKLNLVIAQDLRADLALIVVSPSDAHHYRSRDVPRNSAPLFRLGERLVHEENRAQVPKDGAGFLDISRVMFLGVFVRIEIRDPFLEHLLTLFIVQAVSKSVVRH